MEKLEEKERMSKKNSYINKLKYGNIQDVSMKKATPNIFYGIF